MNLNWLGLATVLPVAVALAVAWSVWKRRIICTLYWPRLALMNS